MYNSKYFIIILTILMFSFFNKVDAKYEKIFFDHTIKNINNEVIDLNQYKGKTILLVNVASKCGFTKQYTRSEEHTSELQSRSDLVCRLLLEKKKHTEHNKN